MPFQSMIIMDKMDEYMQNYDAATAFIDYLCRPAYSIGKGFAEGYKTKTLEELLEEDDKNG
jgi:hypothetical protein